MLELGWDYVILGVTLVLFSLLLSRQEGNADLPKLAISIWFSIACIGVTQEWFVSRAASLVGGQLQRFVVTAFGGGGRFRVVPGWRQALSAGCGPLGSASLSLLLACTLAAFVSETSIVQQLNPFRSLDFHRDGPFYGWASTLCWTGVVLSLVQMLPLRNFAGRTVIDGIIAQWLAPRSEWNEVQRWSLRTVCTIAAIGLLASSLLFLLQVRAAELPLWPFALLVSTMLWMSAMREDPRAERIKLSQKSLGLRGRWRASCARYREHQEADDARKLDGLLDRIQRDGLHSLSASERSILRRISDKAKIKRGDT